MIGFTKRVNVIIISIFLITVFIFSLTRANGQMASQKAPIDNFSWQKWETIKDYQIAPNGKFITFTYTFGQSPDLLQLNKLGIVATDRSWEMHFDRIKETVFTNDSKWLLGRNQNDSLVILNLEKKNKFFISDVTAYTTTDTRSKSLIAYTSKSNFVLYDLLSSTKKKVEGVVGFKVNSKKTDAVLMTKEGLFWLNLSTGKISTIANDAKQLSGNLDNYNFNNYGNQFAYLTQNSGKISIVVFNKDTGKNIILNRYWLSDPQKSVLSASDLKFSENGKYIYFKLAAIVSNSSVEVNDRVKVWRTDDLLLPTMKRESRNPMAVIEVKADTGKIISLEDSDYECILRESSVKGNKFVIIKKWGDDADSYWNEDCSADISLIVFANGERKKIIPKNHKPAGVSLSPRERYVTWKDSIGDCIYAYDLQSNILRNVTSKINLPKDVISPKSLWAPSKFWYVDDLAWLPNDSYFLVRDKYDIWQIDPSGKKAPLNLTGGYGRKHSIIFDLFNFDDFLGQKILDGRTCANKTLILRGTNEDTKDNGYWKVQLGDDRSLKSCVMGPYMFSGGNVAGTVLKARWADTYVLPRQSAKETMNLFVTKDFKTFNQLTFLKPEANYNWMTSELITYPMREGKTGKGVLWKPENFDPNKKYPVIFTYYQEESHNLNVFQIPAQYSLRLDIPWYVSNGYIVFQPDIVNTEPGKIAVNTLNAAESAVSYLSQYKWIDSSKIGLQGHSFGGFETNILVSNSKLFAAAQSFAGKSNMISGAGNLAFGGKDMHSFHERGQPNLGVSIWEDPEVYIRNSPLMQANKVSTPILIVHGETDTSVPFSQAVEYFTALRRLKKKAWLVSYPGQGHGIGGKDGYDFKIRQQQFFDHFLRNKPMPEWMKKGESTEYESITSTMYNEK